MISYPFLHIPNTVACPLVIVPFPFPLTPLFDPIIGWPSETILKDCEGN